MKLLLDHSCLAQAAKYNRLTMRNGKILTAILPHCTKIPWRDHQLILWRYLEVQRLNATLMSFSIAVNANDIILWIWIATQLGSNAQRSHIIIIIWVIKHGRCLGDGCTFDGPCLISARRCWDKSHTLMRLRVFNRRLLYWQSYNGGSFLQRWQFFDGFLWRWQFYDERWRLFGIFSNGRQFVKYYLLSNSNWCMTHCGRHVTMRLLITALLVPNFVIGRSCGRIFILELEQCICLVHFTSDGRNGQAKRAKQRKLKWLLLGVLCMNTQKKEKKNE
jgi:hypothetical protein